ncbi:hypothetical protein [Mangrovimonas aestuarii]|uniref:hypothetical protein n=1 Tax=Mangrovimonas aestuarii TaxID=3018443 RepID=UPI002379E4F6|nr:hypothetical protein [Mangrovimonas aestuarii]
MIKKLLVVFIALIAIKSYAQDGNASPYSFYGIGSLKFKGTVENTSMGGLSIYTDSIHVNLRNPASYASENLKSFANESRPVKFAVAGSHSTTKLESNGGTDKSASSTFDYIAVSIPMNRFGLGFGLMPYTSVGYQLKDSNSEGDLSNKYSGEGGLNKAYFSLAYRITNGLSIGVDTQYNFGNVKNNTLAYLYDNNGDLLTYQTAEYNRSDLSGVNFNFGLSYKTMIKNKFEFVSGLTYTPQSKIGSENERSIATVTVSPTTGQEFIVENIDVEDELIAAGLDKTDLTLPSRYSIGVGIGQPRIWFVGVEYFGQQTSKFNNDLYTSSSTSYSFENASGMSLGGFWIPKYNSYTGYYKRMVYRAGVRYENVGLKVNDESINEFGISFGVGLPVGAIFSNANLGFEFGKRGTTNNGLIQENFANFQLSFSLNDRWFQKPKYD